MLLQRLLRDSVVYGLSGVLARGVLFLLVPIYTRALAPERFGVLDLVIVAGQLVQIIAPLEISQAIPRFQSAARDPDERRAYLATAFWFSAAALTVFVVVATFAAGPLSGVLLGDVREADVLRAALPAYWSGGMAYLTLTQLRWALKPGHYAACTLLLTTVTVGLAVLLVLRGGRGIEGVLVAQTIGNLLGGGLAFGLARRGYATAFHPDKLRAMLRFSLPLVPASIAAFAALYIDRFVISRVRPPADLGLFGVGYRVATVVALLTLGVQAAVTPIVYAHHQQPGTERELARIFRWFVLLALLLWLVVALWARELVALLSTPAYHGGAVVVPGIALALFLANMNVFAPGLSLGGHTGRIAVISVAGGLMSLALNLLLVPRLGIAGAGIANGIAAAISFAWAMHASQRAYRVPHRWRSFALALLATAVAFAVGEGAVRTLDPIAATLVRLGMVGLTGVCGAAAGLVTRDELRMLATALRPRRTGLEST